MQFWRYEGGIAKDLKRLCEMARMAEIENIKIVPSVWNNYARFVQEVAGNRLDMMELNYLLRTFHKAIYGYTVA